MTAGLDFGALMNASALLFRAFGLALVFLARDIDDWPKGLSVAIMSSAAVLSALELLDHAVADTGVSPTLLLVLRNVEVVTAALPSLLMFAYFLYCCGEDYKKSAVMRIQVALTCTLVAAEFLAQLTGEISSAPGAETRLGPWIVLFLALSFATTVVCLVALFRRWKKLSGVQRVMFLIMFLLSFFATDSIVIVFLEFLLSSDLVRHYLAQKEEAAQQQARIAVLQMRPHFIHNTLTSIYYLCAKDPGKAQQAILNFSRYLQMCESANPMHRLWSDGRWLKVQLAAGCYWHRCRFCDVALDYIGNYRAPRAAQAADALLRLRDETGIGAFHFTDEAVPPALCRSLSEELLRRGERLVWWGNVRFDPGFDPATTELMARAGCVGASAGLECANDRLLAEMRKGITLERARAACEAFADAGILVHA